MTIVVSCAYAHPLFVIKKFNFKILKIMTEKIKNLSNLSHANCTFSILDPQIEPQAFRHAHCTFKKYVFLNVKKRPIQGSNWFLGFWSLDACVKWPSRCKVSKNSSWVQSIASCGINSVVTSQLSLCWNLELRSKGNAYVCLGQADVFSKSKNKFSHHRTRLDHYHGPQV
jgi:hypothetical protein